MGLGDYIKPLISIGAAALGWEFAGPVGGAIGWGLGMGIGGALFPPEAEKTMAQSLGPAQSMTSHGELGGVVPVLRGRRRIGGNLIWHGDITTETNDPYSNAHDMWRVLFRTRIEGAVTSTYFMPCAYGICIGPARVLRIYNEKDEYICYNGRAYLLNVGDNVPVEYTNKTAEELIEYVIGGRINGNYITYTEYDGRQTVADPIIVAAKGVNEVPPYRNLHYVVFDKFPVESLSSTAPQLSFESASVEIDVIPVDPDDPDNPDPPPEPFPEPEPYINPVTFNQGETLPLYLYDTYAGNFVYDGHLYVLTMEYTTTTVGGTTYTGMLLAGMKKYTLTDDHTLVHTYTFTKRWLTLDFTANKISVDMVGRQVLAVGQVVVLISMLTLNESGDSQYKVFATCTQYITGRNPGDGLLYWCERTWGSYYELRGESWKYLPDQHCDSITYSDMIPSALPFGLGSGPWPPTLNYNWGGNVGVLIPSKTTRVCNYFITPCYYGLALRSLSDASIIARYTIPLDAIAAGHHYSTYLGTGGTWDRPWVDDLILGDDDNLYVIYSHSWATFVWGEIDPAPSGMHISKWVACYFISTDGTLSLLSRRNLIECGYTFTVPELLDGEMPLYHLEYSGAVISRGYVYIAVWQYVPGYYAYHRGTVLIKLVATTLMPVLAANSVDMFVGTSETASRSTLAHFPQSGGGDFLFFYSDANLLWILHCTDFTPHWTFGSINFVNSGRPFYYHYSYLTTSLCNHMYPSGFRGSGMLVIPCESWSPEPGYVGFQFILWNPEYVPQPVVDPDDDVIITVRYLAMDVLPQLISASMVTNEFYGSGLSPALLHTDRYNESMQQSVDAGFRISAVFDQQRSVLDGFQYLCQHHNGFITMEDGKIAHRQLSLDDSEIQWAPNQDSGDDFDDWTTGDQWNVVGVDPTPQTIYLIRRRPDSVRIRDRASGVKAIMLNAVQAMRCADSYPWVYADAWSPQAISQAMRISEARQLSFDISVDGTDSLVLSDPVLMLLQDPDTLYIGQGTSTVKDSIAVNENASRTFSGGSAEYTYNVGASSDDGRVTGTSLSDSSQPWVGESGGDLYAWMRFTSIGANQGATIVSATLKVYFDAGSGSFTFRTYCKDVDNATAPSSYTYITDDSTYTSAYTSTNYVQGGWSQLQRINFDVKDAVQEVINRGGWSSGNALLFIMDNVDGSTEYARFYDYDNGLAPTLVIEY